MAKDCTDDLVGVAMVAPIGLISTGVDLSNCAQCY